MKLTSIADLENYSRTEVEGAVSAISPKAELLAFLETLNDPEVARAHAETQRRRARRMLESEYKERETFRIEPSSIHGCVRKLWYQVIGEEKKDRIPPKLRCTFDHGTAAHEMLQAWYETMWGWETGFTDECRIVIDDLFISGSTDGLRTTPDFRYLLEFKTIHDKGFTGLAGKPVPYHPKQLHCYMKGMDTPFGFIIYYNKDKDTMLEFPVIFSPTFWETSIENRCQIVLDADEDGPQGDPKSRWDCKFCNYSHLCPHKR